MSRCATSETGPREWHEQHAESIDAPPMIIDVRDVIGPELAEQRINRLVRAAGKVAMNASGMNAEGLTSKPIYSLGEAIGRAADGDPVAMKLVDQNARADVVERTIKSGHVRKVEIGIGEDGKFRQFGQTMEEVTINSLNYASDNQKIHDRTIAETGNFVNAEVLYRLDWLYDYYLVVDSPTADDMSDKELEDNHFFKDTMSCSFQAMTVENGKLVLETAFVAGVKNPGGERHDLDTLRTMAASEGADYSGMSASEIIGRAKLIHKSKMPNGLIDRVKLYDDTAGGTFFGEDKPRVDYLEYLKTCEERERAYDPVVKKIVAQLISESAGLSNDPLAAIERLNEVSEKYTLEMSVTDKRIDPRVFGETAAPHIEQARLFYEQGRPDLVNRAVNKAQSVASSGSCPSANKKQVDGLEKLPDGLEDMKDGSNMNEEKYEIGESDRFGSLEFKCTEGHPNKRKKNELLDECQKKPCKGAVCAPKKAKQASKEDRTKTNKGTSDAKLFSFISETKIKHEGKKLVGEVEAFLAKSSGRLALSGAVQ